ncbi:hypothetical protein PG984_014493 [Apiospora sp. TS-2023a]
MASFLRCPVEIVLVIIRSLPKSSKDLASLVLVNRLLDAIVTEDMYSWKETTEFSWKTPDFRRALHWVAFIGRTGTFSARPGPWVSDFAGSGPGRPRYRGERLYEDHYGY